MTNEIIKGGDAAQVIEVSIGQLTEHSKQADFSPDMGKKKWAQFVAGIAKEGVLQPLSVTRGFRVIDGKHRLRAARELGIESLRVVIEDIPEDNIAAYIAETKLNRDDLKPGQKAALVIRLFYEEERQKARERKSEGGALGNDIRWEKSDGPNLDHPKETGRTYEVLAKKAGIGKSNMANLLAVYKARTDLFQKVFDGDYSINKAYTEMKRDAEPEPTPEESPVKSYRKELEEALERENTLPQVDESEPATSLDNRLVQMRKKALSLTVEVLDEGERISSAKKPEVRDSARSQLLSLAKSCLLALGQSAEDDDDMEIFTVCFELLKKTTGGSNE